MIESMTLINFENHEHTVLDGFSPWFNLIWADSEVGKSAFVRALRLVGYNDFDPQSVRVGCDNCVVEVRTDKGVVRVTRGKDNLWEVTPNGEQTQVFERIGVKILPEAVRILGLKEAPFGELSVPVNLMDQFEGHFMLAEVDGEKASGSMRAQMVDEISGLTGVEDLVRAVSLDNLRNSKALNQLEERRDELLGQLHDEAELDREDGILARAEALVEERDARVEKSSKVSELFAEHGRVGANLRETTDVIGSLPDADKAKAIVPAISDSISHSSKASLLLREHERIQGDMDAALLSLSNTPDANNASSIVRDQVVPVMERLRGVTAVVREAASTKSRLSSMEGDIEAIREEEERLFRERDEVLSEITVCPLSLRPVSPSCLEGMRSPVLTNEQERRFDDEKVHRKAYKNRS